MKNYIVVIESHDQKRGQLVINASDKDLAKEKALEHEAVREVKSISEANRCCMCDEVIWIGSTYLQAEGDKICEYCYHQEYLTRFWINDEVLYEGIDDVEEQTMEAL